MSKSILHYLKFIKQSCDSFILHKSVMLPSKVFNVCSPNGVIDCCHAREIPREPISAMMEVMIASLSPKW